MFYQGVCVFVSVSVWPFWPKVVNIFATQITSKQLAVTSASAWLCL